MPEQIEQSGFNAITQTILWLSVTKTTWLTMQKRALANITVLDSLSYSSTSPALCVNNSRRKKSGLKERGGFSSEVALYKDCGALEGRLEWAELSLSAILQTATSSPTRPRGMDNTRGSTSSSFTFFYHGEPIFITFLLILLPFIGCPLIHGYSTTLFSLL